MAGPPSRRGHPVRGLVKLTASATLGLADLVEAVHARVLNGPLAAGRDAQDRTTGLTGMVYRGIRGVTRLAGAGADELLALLEPALGRAPGLPQSEALVSALNGVLGDHLEQSHNPLAIPMGLHHGGRPLLLEKAALAAALPEAGDAPLLLIHGLCMNEQQWRRAGHDHGAALARDLGFTPLYLRYNTGLHIARNGQALADLLEDLVAQWPGVLRSLTLLGHSMGGLLARSALHYGAAAGHRWPALVDDLLFLGTPHHGAPLERLGHWFELLLDQTPYATPFARLGRVRSEGITDLRHGSLLEQDWQGRDRFSAERAAPMHLPLPAQVRCYTIAGSIGARRDDLKDRLLGDGLVPLDSALGRHADPLRTLAFAPERQWIGYGLGHLALLGDPAVYAQLLQWLRPWRTSPPA
ncbi:alpha/beta hydrolase [Mitsuaria sp. WAJ17]|uniref:esterase/lipase family protein n=1 Tax=Mitsuaria sp. WAJ17 TaxID=2761452 RepID=UPI0016002BE4|nr:alpha/beta hydrolase [Mitsuaria sp. WAJ17]MBB2484090.1 alpha/beta hydrolase [Mitsuaria sp. WAJ17]